MKDYQNATCPAPNGTIPYVGVVQSNVTFQCFRGTPFVPPPLYTGNTKSLSDYEIVACGTGLVHSYTIAGDANVLWVSGVPYVQAPEYTAKGEKPKSASGEKIRIPWIQALVMILLMGLVVA